MKYSIPELDLDQVKTKKTKFEITHVLVERAEEYLSSMTGPFIIGELIIHLSVSISTAEEILSILEKNKKVIRLSDADKKKAGFDQRSNVFSAVK